MKKKPHVACALMIVFVSSHAEQAQTALAPDTHSAMITLLASRHTRAYKPPACKTADTQSAHNKLDLPSNACPHTGVASGNPAQHKPDAQEMQPQVSRIKSLISATKSICSYDNCACAIDLVAFCCLLHSLNAYHTELYQAQAPLPTPQSPLDFSQYGASFMKPINFFIFFGQEAFRLLIYKSIAKIVAWYCTADFKKQE
jgi:hypothetical protein